MKKNNNNITSENCEIYSKNILKYCFSIACIGELQKFVLEPVISKLIVYTGRASCSVDLSR